MKLQNYWLRKYKSYIAALRSFQSILKVETWDVTSGFLNILHIMPSNPRFAINPQELFHESSFLDFQTFKNSKNTLSSTYGFSPTVSKREFHKSYQFVFERISWFSEWHFVDLKTRLLVIEARLCFLAEMIWGLPLF